VASGARYRRLPVDRLEQFEGNGVYYAATEMERRQCATSPTVVVGGGNSAGQAAMFLSDSGPVTVVIRGDDLGKSMSRYLTDRIDAHPGITVRKETRVTELVGDPDLRAVRMEDADGVTEVPCAGLFSFIGAEPSSDWISGCAAFDENGFVLTDRALERRHFAGFCVGLQLLLHLPDFEPRPSEAWLAGISAARDDEAARWEVFWLGWQWEERFHPAGGPARPGWLVELRADQRVLACRVPDHGERYTLSCPLCGRAFSE